MNRPEEFVVVGLRVFVWIEQEGVQPFEKEFFDLRSKLVEILVVAHSNQTDEDGDELLFVELVVARQQLRQGAKEFLANEIDDQQGDLRQLGLVESQGGEISQRRREKFFRHFDQVQGREIITASQQTAHLHFCALHQRQGLQLTEDLTLMTTLTQSNAQAKNGEKTFFVVGE